MKDNNIILVAENKKLKDNIITLEIKIAQLNKELFMNIKDVKDFKNLHDQNEKLEGEIKNLRENLILKENEMNNKMIESENRFNNEISKLKQENAITNQKYDFINQMSTYVHSLEELNEDMERQLKKSEIENQKNLRIEYERNKIAVDGMRKKTLDTLIYSKNTLHSDAIDNLSNKNKLTMLQNYNLQCELNDQGKLLEDFLNQINKKESIIRSLKIDLDIRKELEKFLVINNKKLIKMIKDLRIYQIKIEEENSNNKTKIITNNIDQMSKTGHSFFQIKSGLERSQSSFFGKNKSGTPFSNNLITNAFTNANNTGNVTANGFFKNKQKIENFSKSGTNILNKNYDSQINFNLNKNKIQKYKTVLDNFEEQLLKTTKNIFCKN